MRRPRSWIIGGYEVSACHDTVLPVSYSDVGVGINNHHLNQTANKSETQTKEQRNAEIMLSTRDKTMR